jgi:tripartite-type tricarboxylate transporter receptor subunit TctC
MTTMRGYTWSRGVVTLLALMYALPLQAADTGNEYPTRPIRMIVPFPTGFASDFLARTISQKLSELYGKQVIVDNRPGGGGVVGSVLVAKAAADGYTLSTVGLPHIVNVLIVDQPQYRPLEDFSPIAQLASLPNFVVVAGTAGSLQELVALAKQKPGQLNFGSGGVGSQSHIAGELFKLAAGINAVHVPFRTLGDAMTEMISQRVHYYLMPVTAAMPVLKDARFKALAVTVDKRIEQAPDVPTTAEAGLPGFTIDGWFGVVGPAGMPKSLVNRLNADIVGILKQPDTRERFQRQGSEPVYTTPATFEKMMKDELARYREVVKAAGIRAQ